MLRLPAKNWNSHIRAAMESEDEQRDRTERLRRSKWPRATRPSLEIGGYCGVYEHPAYGKATVTLKKGGLHWSWANFSGALQHNHFDVFTISNRDMNAPQLVFEIGEDAKVAAFSMVGGLDAEFRRIKK